MFHFRETFLTLNRGKKSETQKDNLLQKLLSDFFSKQTKKVSDKIIWTFNLVEDVQRVPETYLKYLANTDGLY